MIDISACGAEVEIDTGSGKIHITQFSDEGTPFECPDVDLSDNKKNLNGQMISSRTPSVYTVSLTVVPGSTEDRQLTKLAQMSSIAPGNVRPISQIVINSITLRIPEINESSEETGKAVFTWSNGRMKGAPTGPSTSSEGRMAARTFTFEMEQFQPATGTGYDV
jgi:hypothetical protein